MLQEKPARRNGLSDVADLADVPWIGQRVNRHSGSADIRLIEQVLGEPRAHVVRQLRLRQRGIRAGRLSARGARF